MIPGPRSTKGNSGDGSDLKTRELRRHAGYSDPPDEQTVLAQTING